MNNNPNEIYADSNDMVACFKDTRNFSKSVLESKTSKAIKGQTVYNEGFRAERIRNYNSNADIIIEESTSFNAARRYHKFGRTAVLNFANPVKAGGGVYNGAAAQEECLCRSSNLYEAISDSSVYEAYYGYNRGVNNNFNSDRVIYTRDITIFKTDDLLPQLLETGDWIDVDVITCAAPYIAKRKYTNKKALKELFKSRITNIFETALDNNVEVMVLGAFGCGAFKNPPNIVASSFYDVIYENSYDLFFKKIIFAIKRTGYNNMICPNILAFEMEFLNNKGDMERVHIETSERSKLKCVSVSSYYNRPEEKIKMNNPYFEKQFSILGDSISTLEGYNPRNFKLFYMGENSIRTNVRNMEDTWWGKVINFFGGDLLVNNSWSGSRVTYVNGHHGFFPSGCSDERTGGLHINKINPDVILVYMGTNDWAFGADVETGEETVLITDAAKIFEYAYQEMLRKLKCNYPNAEIWCCTLSETYVRSRSSFRFPYEYAGIHIEKFNNVIRNAVIGAGCKLIDFFSYHIPYESLDGTHPTDNGMQTLADLVVRSMVENRRY